MAPVDRIRAYLDKERDALSGCRLGRLAFDAGLDAGTAAPIAAYFTGLQRTLTRLINQAVTDLTGAIGADGLAASIVACVQGGYVLAAATGDRAAMSRAMLGLRQLLDAAAPGRTPAQARHPRKPAPPRKPISPAGQGDDDAARPH